MSKWLADRELSRRRWRLWLLSGVSVLLLAVGTYHVYKPLPPGLDVAAPERVAGDVQFLADVTYSDADGERHMEQQIFDAVLDMIANARQLLVVDMFLFNDFQGAGDEPHRVLSSELTAALIDQKQRYPELEVQVISDPLNELYGGLPSPYFAQLTAAGIPVTLTDLSQLRDSNPAYSVFWRTLFQHWGNGEADTLPSPFGEGRVSLRSYLALLNFKANHRKLVIADSNGELTALVASANPHDGSSAHGNVALRFSGLATGDLLASENAVLRFSGGSPAETDLAPEAPDQDTGLTVQVVTERAVERAVIELIDGAAANEQLDMAVFYLSDRNVVRALKRAVSRGVMVRLMLDPNKDAFGREKNGIPNRPVAHELTRAGTDVRWCDTRGEQCHAKWVLHRSADGQASMLLGSSNFTRRNLRNINLETSVVLRGPISAEPLQNGLFWFEQRWNNEDGRQFSVDYDTYADDNLFHRILYRWMEATGMSTF